MPKKQKQAMQEVLTLSQQMLAYAEKDQWEEVVKLETGRDTLVEQALATSPSGAENINEVRLAIQEMLRMNALITERLSAYQDSVAGQLQSIGTGREATKAYQKCSI
jgi:uncharacterized protein with PhoU and TrkA domain